MRYEKRMFILTIVMAFVFFLFDSAHSESRIDQSFTDMATLTIFNIDGGCANGQTFTAGLTGVLTGTNLYLNTSQSFNYSPRVSIYSTENGIPTTDCLGSVLLPAGTTIDLSVMITFPELITVQEGTKYAIVLDYPESQDSDFFVGSLRGTNLDGYSGGSPIYFKTSTGYWETSNYEVWFRTYVEPNEFYVSTAGNDTSGDGSEENPWDTIQHAVDAVSDGSTIYIADGIYSGFGNKDIDFNGKKITVISKNGPENCIIDCENDGRGFLFINGEDENSILSGITITNGFADYGGGILCRNSSPKINNCMIIGNKAVNNGGGIYCRPYASPNIENCTIRGNSIEWLSGVGIYCGEYSSPKIINCTIVENQHVYVPEQSPQPQGGGIYIYHYSNPEITGSIISNNNAYGGGGGICVVYQCDPVFKNCLITNNNTSAGGGGMIVHMSSPSIINCTFSANISENDGGGIYYQADSNITVINTILWGDSPNEISENQSSTSSTISISYSDIQGGIIGEGNINIDPLFLSPNDFHLQEFSPCIDIGTSDSAPAFDFEENYRPNGGGFDIGAFEYYDSNSIIQVSPASIDFGEYRWGAIGGPLAVELSNTGDTVLDVTDISLSDTENFQIYDDPGGSCGTSMTLQPGENCVVSIVFTPIDTNIYEYSTDLTIKSDDQSNSEIIIPVTGSADDYGGSCETSTSLSEDHYITGELERGGDKDFFYISIPYKGTVHISTGGTTNTNGELFDSNYKLIAGDDDGGEEYNFSIEALVTPGDYYIAVSHSDMVAGTGSYELHYTLVPDRLVKTSWAQSGPSHNYYINFAHGSDSIFLPDITRTDGTRYLVGCSAIAVGQLINYYFTERGYSEGWLDIMLKGRAVYPRFADSEGNNVSQPCQGGICVYTNGFLTEDSYIRKLPDTFNIGDGNPSDEENLLRAFLWTVAIGLDSRFDEGGAGTYTIKYDSEYYPDTTNLPDKIETLLRDRFRFNPGLVGQHSTQLSRLDTEQDYIIQSIDNGHPVLLNFYGNIISSGEPAGHLALIDAYHIDSKDNFYVFINWGWGNKDNVDDIPMLCTGPFVDGANNVNWDEFYIFKYTTPYTSMAMPWIPLLLLDD